MKARFGSHLLLPAVFLLLAAMLACSDTGDATSPTSAPATSAAPSIQTAKPLTASDRMEMDEFVEQQQVISREWDQFYQEFDDWRAGLTACHSSSAQEALQEFAASFNDVTGQARSLPRASSTRELADILIAAAEEEEAAFRQLRDRWQPGNVSFFELVEQKRSDAARAQKKTEDLALELQEKFEEGYTPEEVEEAEEFSEAFDAIEDAWDEFHDAYITLRKEENKLDSVALIARYGQLIEQSGEMVAAIAELSSTDTTEDIVEMIQGAAEAELAALINLTEALAVLASAVPAPGTDTETGEATPPPSTDTETGEPSHAPDADSKIEEPPATAEPPASPPPGQDPGLDLGTLQDEVDVAVNESKAVLKEVRQAIDEIIDDKSAENLADIENFNIHYKRLVAEWDAFHQRYNDWRKTEGGCDRTEALQALDRFNQRLGELGRKVRDLPQSGFLLPMYTLLVEAAEREEGAMRTLRNSWRPFAVDAFRAVDQGRVDSDRLRRQANIGLQELGNHP